MHKVLVNVTNPLTVETQMHTAGPIYVSRFIAMVMRDFGPVICVSVSIARGVVNLTLN